MSEDVVLVGGLRFGYAIRGVEASAYAANHCARVPLLVDGHLYLLVLVTP